MPIYPKKTKNINFFLLKRTRCHDDRHLNQKSKEICYQLCRKIVTISTYMSER